MPSTAAAFASVKLPTALVQQARDAAQPLRRSVAGQVEYWATLGRIVEHSGLTAQEARDAIEGYEAATCKLRLTSSLEHIEAQFAVAEVPNPQADDLLSILPFVLDWREPHDLGAGDLGRHPLC